VQQFAEARIGQQDGNRNDREFQYSGWLNGMAYFW
jgi:hypothetical protein